MRPLDSPPPRPLRRRPPPHPPASFARSRGQACQLRRMFALQARPLVAPAARAPRRGPPPCAAAARAAASGRGARRAARAAVLASASVPSSSGQLTSPSERPLDDEVRHPPSGLPARCRCCCCSSCARCRGCSCALVCCAVVSARLACARAALRAVLSVALVCRSLTTAACMAALPPGQGCVPAFVAATDDAQWTKLTLEVRTRVPGRSALRAAAAGCPPQSRRNALFATRALFAFGPSPAGGPARAYNRPLASCLTATTRFAPPGC
jgi:hypothetical protein